MSTIWAFDLGKGSIGEAVWNTDEKQFDHVASLLIPAEFASTKEASSRRPLLRLLKRPRLQPPPPFIQFPLIS